MYPFKQLNLNGVVFIATAVSYIWIIFQSGFCVSAEQMQECIGAGCTDGITRIYSH